MKKIILFLFRIYSKLRTFIHTSIVKATCRNRRGKVKVNFLSKIGRNVFLGHNVHFNGMNISSGGRVTIGDNFHSGKDCLIICLYHNYNGSKIPYDNTNIYKDVTIEDNVWIGHRTIILGGVTIGEGAIIQAGAVVVKSIPPCAIAGGNPATVFKFRDKDHYYRLKLENKFH